MTLTQARLTEQSFLQVKNKLYVDGNRTDTYVSDGSIIKPYKTIQAAIDAVVSPSATNKYMIEIAPGAYYSNPVAINKGFITFKGGGFNNARITGAITVTKISGGVGSEHVYLNGIRQKPTADYTISTNVISFIDAPVSTDTILVDYRK